MKSHRIFISMMLCGLVACHEHSGSGSANDSIPAMHHADHSHHMSHTGNDQPAIDHSEMIVLSEREKMLAGIRIDSVRKKDLIETLTVLGIVTNDVSSFTSVSAPVTGRVEKLYRKNTGESIHTGEPLFDLYSETLLAEEQELIGLVSNRQSETLIESARDRLQKHGLKREQIRTIETSGQVNAVLTVFSQRDGFLNSLPVKEGQYVEKGEQVLTIASLDIVDVNAQVYPGEISSFRSAENYSVTAGGNDSTVYPARIITNDPSFRESGSVHYVLLEVKNRDHLLLPGMRTSVKAQLHEQLCLVIPRDALCYEENMTFVWVQEMDGMFSRRMITIGKENSEFVEVMDGLQIGDIIVSHGVYLLNSEYILRKGANNMSGMKM